MAALRIGVIVDDPAQIPALRGVVTTAGQELAVALEFSRSFGRIADAGVDAWVVNLDIEMLEATHPEPLDHLLDSIDVPLILCEGQIPNLVSPEFANWRNRLLEKLRSLNGAINRSQRDAPPLPRSVWVLAGSIGGPEAVREFIEALPGDLGIGFIYANHIERDYQSMLAQVMSKNGRYSAFAPRHGDLLEQNGIAVISPDFVTAITRDGSFNVRNSPWAGQYKPNLDQVVATTAVHFGSTGGVIVFSGMCDDAAAACRIMRRCGGQVWVQEPDTCVSWTMPSAASLAVGHADFVGSPGELAEQLTRWAAANQRRLENAPKR
ncbi:MAG TPA: chemotaxis protein CheB [Pseudomonadales bacterium]|nr:chemotaxis protein CheB [Pseudomonadales bacterium]